MTSPHIDPVCGMHVENDRISTLHDGVRHVFCSTQCQQKFVANPAAYLKPLASGVAPTEKKGCCG